MMTLELTPQNGGETVLTVELMRNGSANLPDGTIVEYEAFLPDFVLNQGKPDTRSAQYNNPAVVLNITTPDGEKNRKLTLSARNCPTMRPSARRKPVTNGVLPSLKNRRSHTFCQSNTTRSTRRFHRLVYRRFRFDRRLCFVFFIRTNEFGR
jgi:hypothetical protein